MKHFLHFIVASIFTIGILWSCQKEPEFIYSGPSSIELKADGSSSTMTFSANRNWAVTSSDSWVSVSPSSGAASDGPITISISCNPNTTYEDRSATVTIMMEGFTQVVTVLQPANKGIVLPTKSYILASGERSFEVEVQANVEYSASASVDWIKQISTKGLVSGRLSFSVEENTAIDDREGRITVKALDGSVPEQAVGVIQSGKDALIVKDASYDMPYGGGAVEVKVEANVEFDVKTDSDWIHFVQTKAMGTSIVCLSVDENLTYSPREGKVRIEQKGGALSHTVIIRQAERIAVSSVELNKASLILPLGESETLFATIKPDNASDLAVSWESDHPEVVTVSDQGLVTAVSEGTATITAKAANGISATCIVSAQNIAPRNQIWYTSASGKPIDVKTYWGDVSVVSNTYENGKGVIVLDKDLEIVPQYFFSDTDITSVEIPEGTKELAPVVFGNCHDLRSVKLPSSLRIIGSSVFRGCDSILRIDIDAKVPPKCVLDVTGDAPFGRPYIDSFSWPIYVPDEFAEDYANAVGWKDYLPRLFTKSGKPLLSYAYKSTDYSRDGEVVLLQKATVGNGIDVVFLGDGFIDKDMETDGWYEQSMRRGMEILFCWEPFKTFRDRFNIYTIKCVSSVNSYGLVNADRYFSTDIAGESSFVKVWDKGLDDIPSFMEAKIPKTNNDSPTFVLLLYNTELAIGTSCSYAGQKLCCVYGRTALSHEFGHSFGELSDEYIRDNGKGLTDDDRRYFDQAHSIGEEMNIDYRNDPSTVIWSRFISDNRYSDEGIGVFQGASISKTELYRPTHSSCMKTGRLPFNAPSREAIYKHIMQYSEGESWTYDYEEFVKADAGGHQQWMSHMLPDGSVLYIEFP